MTHSRDEAFLSGSMKPTVVPFESLLRDFTLEQLDQKNGATYGLWPDLTLAYINPAWYRFAEENGGGPAMTAHWDVGAPLLDAVPLVLRPFYETAYRRCLRSGKPWEHLYECSSGDLFRRFYQTIYPLPEGGGLLVVNALLFAVPHNPDLRIPHAPSTVYRDPHGRLDQCAHCRRICRRGDVRWDWVPEWVEQIPPGTRHGLCPRCTEFYYPLAVPRPTV